MARYLFLAAALLAGGCDDDILPAGVVPCQQDAKTCAYRRAHCLDNSCEPIGAIK